ncbi:HAD family hydrolase [Proteiniborus sp.]|uniref:HAD family hydrolase n=1 Tax=Proteiniborus sp. TaxID=2079015 RepID=UPI00333128B8
MSNKWWHMVKDFQMRFGHPYRDTPKLLDTDRVCKRYNWMLEEINEFKEANDIYEQADAMIDLMYFALGTLVEMGVKPDKIFEIVHKANMDKLWSDGKPHFKEDGKTVKPEGWKDPYPKIKEEIDSQGCE